MKRITLADIAREAGVSKATVSRVLSNPGMVKPATRKRIDSLIEKYAFIPNNLARGLAGNPTRNIGVVIDEMSNFFFIEIAEGIDGVLSHSGYSMQISSSRWILENEIQIIKNLLSSRVDGILLAPVFSESESINLLKRSGVPFILINCIPEDPAISFISCDNRKGGKLAAEYINRLNRSQTIVLTGYEHQTLKDRFEGFSEFFDRKNGADFIHYPDIKTFDEGYELAPVLVVRNQIQTVKTVLFITNDNVALGVITRLLELGIQVPEQVSVVGYDDIRLSSLCRVPLTTISQSIKTMGKIAALELLEMMGSSGGTGKASLIEPSLVIRDSASRCP